MDEKPASVPDRFLRPYDPASTEDRIYSIWEKSGYFDPDKLPERNQNGEPFTIVLPPPNVTGVLHMGSALMLAIEDIMVRYARMKGRRTLWIPGTDHAAIATQAVVEKKIQKEEGKNRRDLGREELLRRIGAYATETHDTIVKQMRKMGASLDWSREAFTLDDKRNLSVRTAFKRMYDDGLIYRGHRVVNWDPKGQTTISDDEIEYVEEKAKFYYFKYGPFVIGTARPETKFGDKYVVMHPDDPRYAAYKDGQKIGLEWINGPITATVVKDASIDREFGTGVMTITPWHSNVDFEIAERHKLDKEQIIDRYGRLLPIAGEFAGTKIAEARQKIVEKLASKGLLVREEDYVHNIATAQRSGGFIEPQIMNQWFVAVNKEFKHAGRTTTLKDLMKEAVSSGAVKIIPDRFERVYFNWIDNLRDWCISRQIWYGHRLPVWYKGGETYCGMEAPKGAGWTQDEDTLDTWFSSGLWTFSTLGWPDEKEFKANRQYHPTTILETGSDIIFFWVARMILMSTYLLDEVPFKTVYLHGIVRDPKGRKISKSLGNNVDPLEMIGKYGSDAVRMSLIVGIGPGSDSKIDEQKIRAYKLFANKLWNIARFIFTYAVGGPQAGLNKDDQKILDDWNGLVKEITAEMDQYKYYLVGEKLYHYAWHELADKLIEESKPILSGSDRQAKESRSRALLAVFSGLIAALHPFMPYITEEIWSAMPSGKGKGLLMVEKWPG
ncbi:MAG: valine--tRNA ligase [Minisyncoccia bacterium]|jgi:valyl-tRNA synthetase